MIEVAFRNDDLDRLETDARFTAGLPPEVVKAYRLRMQQIRAAPDEREFREHPGWHYELLEPKKDGVHSIRLNKQWRLVFVWEDIEGQRTLVVLAVEDYH